MECKRIKINEWKETEVKGSEWNVKKWRKVNGR